MDLRHAQKNDADQGHKDAAAALEQIVYRSFAVRRETGKE